MTTGPISEFPTTSAAHCTVTHAPGRTYVCWHHRKFLPWSEPFRIWTGCCCDAHGADMQAGMKALQAAESLR